MDKHFMHIIDRLCVCVCVCVWGGGGGGGGGDLPAFEVGVWVSSCRQ